ncbi:MAG: hypothetical protein KF739_01005 [Cryobacterium sp.]|nr:hypothetical protein [Cryobacterium sp.]
MARKSSLSGVGNKKRASQKRAGLPLQILWVGIAVVAVVALGSAIMNGTFRQAEPGTSFSIVSPTAGSTVTTPVDLVVALKGATIGVPADGLDHLHVSIDGGQLLALYQTPELNMRLSQGDHTVVVELAGPSHQALLPAQTVSFVVR